MRSQRGGKGMSGLTQCRTNLAALLQTLRVPQCNANGIVVPNMLGIKWLLTWMSKQSLVQLACVGRNRIQMCKLRRKNASASVGHLLLADGVGCRDTLDQKNWRSLLCTVPMRETFAHGTTCFGPVELHLVFQQTVHLWELTLAILAR